MKIQQKCLDKGFVQLVRFMGSDESIVQSARLSYGKGTKQVHNTAGLIRYLMRNRHTSPFEMVELHFHIKAPLFVARHLLRHRTASVNELSARYSQMEGEFYIPDAKKICSQSVENKQGRSNIPLSVQNAKHVQTLLSNHATKSFELYEHLCNDDVTVTGEKTAIARELARMCLPLNIYTQFDWKIDLHNLLNFLELRLAKNAQYETRVFAQAMYKMVAKLFPITLRAFTDYRINSLQLSRLDIEAIVRIHLGEKSQIVLSSIFKNKRELSEFKLKANKLLVPL